MNSRSLFNWLYCSFIVVSFSAGTSVSAEVEVTDDYTEMSLQKLMSLEIFTSASLLPTELKKAPGTVYSFNRSNFECLGVQRLDDCYNSQRTEREFWAKLIYTYRFKDSDVASL
ncbi:MAG: hypothetical protein GY694_09955 [Gammaproteobacteria bacterium]|nr:hypothetical protein [Gammaproteobacteria bacterium]